MSPRLTLLFLCNRVDSNAVFIPAFISAGFHLLIARHTEEAKTLLSSLEVDAIFIWHEGVSHLAGAELKLVTDHTPVILLRDQGQGEQRPPGVDSVCQLDPRDEVLAFAVAVFFRQSLGASRSNALAVMPDKKARLARRDGDAKLAV
jgi:hypothetical protein